MTDPSPCPLLFAAATLVAFLGWGAWFVAVRRFRAALEERIVAESAISIAPPVRAEIWGPPEPDRPSPEWVMERMMDESFERVEPRSERKPTGSAWT